MNTYNEIIHKINLLGEKSPLLLAAVIVGSQARSDHAADESSDLDVILFVKDTEYFLCSNEWVELIGKHYVSFIKNTVFGVKERRILFEGCLDVDFVIAPEGAISDPKS